MIERKLGLWKTDLIGNFSKDRKLYVCMHVHKYVSAIFRQAGGPVQL